MYKITCMHVHVHVHTHTHTHTPSTTAATHNTIEHRYKDVLVKVARHPLLLPLDTANVRSFLHTKSTHESHLKYEEESLKRNNISDSLQKR